MSDRLTLADALQEFLRPDDWDEVWHRGSVNEGWRRFRPMLIDGTVDATGIKHGLQDVGRIDAELWDSYEPCAKYLRNPCDIFGAGGDQTDKLGFWNWHRLLNPREPQTEDMSFEEIRDFERQFREENPTEYERRKTETFLACRRRTESGRDIFLEDVEPRELGTPIWDDDKLLVSIFWDETTGMELRGIRFQKAGAATSAYRTGAAGRPSSQYLVEGELDRRIEAGTLEMSGVGAQARALVDWLNDKYPNAPRMKPRSVENVIRKPYKKARSLSAQN